MHELIKLEESRYFYSMICKEFQNSNFLAYNLSAFLAAARSVLQYALKEAKTKSGGKHWYDTKVSVSPILSFFKDKRDINIHEEPVKPLKHTGITLVETVRVSESITVTKYDASGNLLDESTSESITEPEKSYIPPVVTHHYQFVDWPGNEDLLTLSQMSLDELRRMVDDGIARGFITG